MKVQLLALGFYLLSANLCNAQHKHPRYDQIYLGQMSEINDWAYGLLNMMAGCEITRRYLQFGTYATAGYGAFHYYGDYPWDYFGYSTGPAFSLNGYIGTAFTTNSGYHAFGIDAGFYQIRTWQYQVTDQEDHNQFAADYSDGDKWEQALRLNLYGRFYIDRAQLSLGYYLGYLSFGVFCAVNVSQLVER